MSDQPAGAPEQLLEEANEIGKYAYNVFVRCFVPNPITPMPEWESQSIIFRSAFVTAIVSAMRKYTVKDTVGE